MSSLLLSAAALRVQASLGGGGGSGSCGCGGGSAPGRWLTHGCLGRIYWMRFRVVHRQITLFPPHRHQTSFLIWNRNKRRKTYKLSALLQSNARKVLENEVWKVLNRGLDLGVRCRTVHSRFAKGGAISNPFHYNDGDVTAVEPYILKVACFGKGETWSQKKNGGQGRFFFFF